MCLGSKVSKVDTLFGNGIRIEHPGVVGFLDIKIRLWKLVQEKFFVISVYGHIILVYVISCYVNS